MVIRAILAEIIFYQNFVEYTRLFAQLNVNTAHPIAEIESCHTVMPFEIKRIK